MSHFKANLFSQKIINWFDKNQRTLPWRIEQTPYRVWISEIMLQQTRVEAVIGFYHKWMNTWPDINSLAKASETDVLNHWKGLGYYSRAKNILKTAKIIVTDLNGVFPFELQELLKLPGIGRYTAGAICSIALEKPVSIVDGNVARVYSRVFLSGEMVNTPNGIKHYYDIADDLLPKKNLRSFNQGLMELGAIVCVPSRPKCAECPVKGFCLAFQKGLQESYPIRKSKKKTEQLYKLVVVIKHRNRFFMQQQNEKGRYHGMWEFPGVMLDGFENAVAIYEKKIQEFLGADGHLGEMVCAFSHSFTHYKQNLQVYSFALSDKSIQLHGSWFDEKALQNLPMGSAQVKILKQLSKG